MDSQVNDTKITARVVSSASSGSNQLYIAESLELPEDEFRMSLDNFSVIGENVTIAADRDTSVDTLSSSNVGTPVLATPTPTPTPETGLPPEKSSPIIDTPKVPVEENRAENVRKQPPKSLQLSLSKMNDYDFAKPSPVAELMSPAKIKFEMNYAASSTPTMKRAPIDFEFFKKNKQNELFEEEPEEIVTDLATAETEEAAAEIEEAATGEEEEPDILKANTVRHVIQYAIMKTKKLIKKPIVK